MSDLVVIPPTLMFDTKSEATLERFTMTNETMETSIITMDEIAVDTLKWAGNDYSVLHSLQQNVMRFEETIATVDGTLATTVML